MKLLKLSQVTIFLIFVSLILISSNLLWGKKFWKHILQSDAKGYYAYLPATFIYQDLNFTFFDHIEKEKYYLDYLYYDYRSSFEGKTINKYYSGTALVQTPFFCLAHLLTKATGYEADGYSKLYLIFVNIAALIYLLIGLIFLNKILTFYDIGELQKSLTILATVFGTNLFYYAVVESGMSHVYSFSFICMFLFFSKKYFQTFSKNYLILLAFILGIICLIRPINILILLILPFISEKPEYFKEGIQNVFQNYKTLIGSALLFLGIISIQLVIYKISTGSFFVYSYRDEKFDFLSPHIFDILFSYRKGLFLYTPMYLLGLLGAYFFWKENKFQFFTLIAFLFFITYVFSCWCVWYYGGSFSSRVYVEYLPLFAIPLALAIQKIHTKAIQFTYISLIFLFTGLCQIQTCQYRYQQIHWSEMTKEKYWDVFLRIDKMK